MLTAGGCTGAKAILPMATLRDLPRDAPVPIHVPEDDAPPAPAPRRFALPDLPDLPEPDAPVAPSGYRSPQPSRWRAYRGALLLALACAAAVAVTWAADEAILRGMRDGAGWALERTDDRARSIATVVFAAVAALGLVAAWGRATHPRRAVRLSDGRGRMAVDEIAGALRGSLLERADMRSAEVRVENRHRHGIRVHAWLRVTRDARIDEVLEAVDRATEALARRLGMTLAELPLVDVRYDELDLRAGRLSD